MATTTNFGWETPDDTDLVKDGAAAMRTLGNSIDTSFVDLKGGTTGQVLAKASATDLDYTWTTPQVGDITAITATSPLTGGGTTGDVTVGIQSASTTQSGAVQLTDSISSTSTTTAATPNSVKTSYDLANAAIAKSTLTTTGDIIYRNATIPTRLGIGTTGQILTVSGGIPAWATPASSGGMTLLSTTTLSGASTTISSISQSYIDLVIEFSEVTTASNGQLKLNLNGTQNCMMVGFYGNVSTGQTLWADDTNYISGVGLSGSSANNAFLYRIADYASSINHAVQVFGGFTATASGYRGQGFSGTHLTASAVSSIKFSSDGGNFSGGTVKIYGVK